MGITLFVLPIFFCNITYGRSIEDFDNLFSKAQENIYRGDYITTLQYLNSITKQEIVFADDTTKAFYNCLMGEALVLKGEYSNSLQYLSDAIELYEKIKYKDISYLDIMLNKAFAYDYLDNKENAIRWYRKTLLKANTIEHDPAIDKCCFLNLGNVYNVLGQYEVAKAYYDNIDKNDTISVVEVRGDFLGKMCEKYLDFSRQGDWASAKNINDSLMTYTLMRYGETHSSYLCCLQSAGTIQASLKDYIGAVSPYKQLVDIGKKNSLIIEEVGYAYIRLIEMYCNLDNIDNAIEIFPEAVNYLKKLKNENCSEIEPCLYIGLALIRNMDFENGIIALEKYLDNYPVYMKWGVPYAINKLTWAYLNVGQNEAVVEVLAPLLSQDVELIDSFVPLKPHFHKTLGCSYYVLNEKEKSLFHLNEAIRLDPETMQNDDLITEIITEYNKEK